MDKKGRRTGHGDVLDTCHERGGNSENIRVFKLAAEEVRAAICSSWFSCSTIQIHIKKRVA